MTITKKSTTKTDFGYIITVNLLVKELDVEIINEDFSQNHNENNDLKVAMSELKKKIEARVNKYNNEQTFLKSANLDTEIAALQTSLSK